MANREIKFRAWFDNGKAQDMFFVGDAYGTAHPLDCCRYAKDGQPVTLMQYTGLKDANGVEIYESEIIDFGDLYGEVGTVSYCEDSASFVCSLIESGRVIALAEHLIFGDKHISRKVIGNIYQNPELLK